MSDPADPWNNPMVLVILVVPPAIAADVASSGRGASETPTVATRATITSQLSRHDRRIQQGG